ncbi:hypothetical protein [Desulfolutivibrio sp.]|uniref:hypothetical protein n=1 Tax=Desulfolutivibrio sp. TaxID=2773296 RepID=UPI002F9687C7
MKQLLQPLLFGGSLLVSLIFANSAKNEFSQAVPKPPCIKIVPEAIYYAEPMPNKLFTNNGGMVSVSRADAPGEIETPSPPPTEKSRQERWQPTWP